MNDDSYLKLIIAGITSFLGYVIYGIKRNNGKHDSHTARLNEHDKRIVVSEEQMKHVLNKLDDVITLGNDLKDSNKIILRTLARNTRNPK